MANLLASGAAWLTGVLQSHASDQVSYRPHDLAEFTLDATRGETRFRELPLDQGRGGRITRSFDFLFAADLLRSALERWPEEGDLITAPPSNAVGGVVRTHYRVTSINDEPAWRIDPHSTRVRVHTLEWDEE